MRSRARRWTFLAGVVLFSFGVVLLALPLLDGTILKSAPTPPPAAPGERIGTAMTTRTPRLRNSVFPEAETWFAIAVGAAGALLMLAGALRVSARGPVPSA